MQILVCIDDTDNLESLGTGELAEMLAQEIEKKMWAKCKKITRHQLYVHDEIPYTSHNSSMCFQAKVTNGNLEQIIQYAQQFLEKQAAPGSDPGLCVVNLNQLAASNRLIEFGKRAKKSILTKDIAYQLAKKLNIHLSEHGGTGDGVIGALAGAGLRLSGNDGRFKGRHQIGAPGTILQVEELCQFPDIDEVRNLDGEVLNLNERVILGKKVKTVFLDQQAVLLVYRDLEGDPSGFWKTCTRQQLRRY